MGVEAIASALILQIESLLQALQGCLTPLSLPRRQEYPEPL